MRLLASLLVLTATLIAGFQVPAQAAELRHLWTVDHFHAPAGIVYDEQHDWLVVGNMDGVPTSMNSSGYLSLVSRSGQVLEQVWVDGLHAPFGLALYHDQLVVADVDKLRFVNRKTGVIEDVVPIPGGTSIHDVTVSDAGIMYVSDMRGSRILQFENGVLQELFAGRGIEKPGSIAADDERVLIANWGRESRASAAQSLVRMSPAERSVTNFTIVDTLHAIHHVSIWDDMLVTSDRTSGQLSLISRAGRILTTLHVEPGIADTAHRGDALYVTSSIAGSIHAFEFVE